MSVVLYAAGSSASHSYEVRSVGEQKVEMVESTVGTIANPIVFTQQLALKGPQASGNQRYTASIRRSVTDTATNIPYTGSITSTLSLPKAPVWTSAFTKDLMSEMASVLGAAKAYGTSGAVVSGCTDTSAWPGLIAQLLFVGI